MLGEERCIHNIDEDRHWTALPVAGRVTSACPYLAEYGEGKRTVFMPTRSVALGRIGRSALIRSFKYCVLHQLSLPTLTLKKPFTWHLCTAEAYHSSSSSFRPTSMTRFIPRVLPQTASQKLALERIHQDDAMHSLLTHNLPELSLIEVPIPEDWEPTSHIPFKKTYRRQRVELPG